MSKLRTLLKSLLPNPLEARTIAIYSAITLVLVPHIIDTIVNPLFFAGISSKWHWEIWIHCLCIVSVVIGSLLIKNLPAGNANNEEIYLYDSKKGEIEKNIKQNGSETDRWRGKAGISLSAQAEDSLTKLLDERERGELKKFLNISLKNRKYFFKMVHYLPNAPVPLYICRISSNKRAFIRVLPDGFHVATIADISHAKNIEDYYKSKNAILVR